MTPQQEAAFERKAEKHFKSHPELPNGRTFRFNHEFNEVEEEKYKANFDAIFPNSPGAGI